MSPPHNPPLETVEEPFLPFAKPSLSEAAIAEVVDCLRSGWLTTGPRVEKFQENLGMYLSSPHVLAVSSATAGLYLALKALHLQPGDEVITTSMTFVATLNTIELAGGHPVLVDVDRGTYNLCVDALEKALTPRTKAILPVHFAGLSVDLDPLYAFARHHGLRVIEDAAHAIGTAYKGKKIGAIGDTHVFSFHPNKNITTGEGGCITTHDSTLVSTLETLRFHGIDRMAWNRFSKAGSPHYDVIAPAHKFNMTDIQAALGIHQLNDLESFLEKRAQRVANYYQALQDWPEFTLPYVPTSYEHRHAWHLFAPLLNADVAKMTRDNLMVSLKEYNIGTGLHYLPPHTFEYYKKTYGFTSGDFPNAEYIGQHIISLPLFPDMTDHDFDRVLSALAKILKKKWS